MNVLSLLLNVTPVGVNVDDGVMINDGIYDGPIGIDVNDKRKQQ